MLGRVCPSSADTDTVLYSLPSSKEAAVTRLHIMNWHTAAVPVTVWFDNDASGAAANADYILKAYYIAPGSFIQVDIGDVIKTANNRFVVQAGVINVVTFQLYGEEDDA
jgi:hypothetical protein